MSAPEYSSWSKLRQLSQVSQLPSQQLESVFSHAVLGFFVRSAADHSLWSKLWSAADLTKQQSLDRQLKVV
jgi:hypothetical protein